MDQPTVLDVRNLSVDFETEIGIVNAVSDVSFSLKKGETLAIVGESGSGKTTTINAVLGLLTGNGRVTSGNILFQGKNLAGLPEKEYRKIRGAHLGLVPQDPMSNLNPVLTIGDQVGEALLVHDRATKANVADKVVSILEMAGLGSSSTRLKQYPHQFSGGMRQRVLIGIGLACNPEVLIADEPTSALDVTVQKQILDHLATLTTERGTAMILITHDLGLAAERSEKIIVMRNGRIVEQGQSAEILNNPQHEYTKRLVSAAPSIASTRYDTRSPQVGKARPTEHTKILTVERLEKTYQVRDSNTRRKRRFHAVNDVSFEIEQGKTLAIVGESGSGKSTIARLILRLEEPDSGTISFRGRNMATIRGRELKELRSHMQPVFQDPYSSLNPMASIGELIEEPLKVHGIGNKQTRKRTAVDLLGQVSLDESLYDRFISELSGGQRQRIAIARGLALEPELMICDEPVSALDVIVQAQILELLKRLQSERKLSYLFISHDLAVVRMVAHEVLVMQQGTVIERAHAAQLFENPQEEYTKKLLASIPGREILAG